MRDRDMSIAPVSLLVLGAILLAVTVVMSLTTMHAVGSPDDPPIPCGSIVFPHHYPDATYGAESGDASFAQHKCNGQHTKRMHRVEAAGLLGFALCAGSIALRRRDNLVASRARHELAQELSALKE